MIENFRYFEVTDPFGENWQVKFLWQQNAITIRHADAIDVKFLLISGNRQEKVVAISHPVLLELSAKIDRPITDPWVSRLGAAHIRRMIETWEDMDKTIVSPSLEELEAHHASLEQRPAIAR